MGLLYSDLQVMGSLYVTQPPLAPTHLAVKFGAVQLCSLLLRGAATPS